MALRRVLCVVRLWFTLCAIIRSILDICESLTAVWYVNGVLTPTVYVERDRAYTVRVLGGASFPLLRCAYKST